MRFLHNSFSVACFSASLFLLPFSNVPSAHAASTSEQTTSGVVKVDSSATTTSNRKARKPRKHSKVKVTRPEVAKTDVSKKDVGEPPAEVSGVLPQAKKAALAKKEDANVKPPNDNKAEDVGHDNHDKKIAGLNDDKKVAKKSSTHHAKSHRLATRSSSRKNATHKRRHARAKSAHHRSRSTEAKSESSSKPPAASESKLRVSAHTKSTTRKLCLNESVSFTRIGQPYEVSFPLTTCDGQIAPKALEQLSLLALPYQQSNNDASKTTVVRPVSFETKPKTSFVDRGLVLRLQAIAQRFSGKTITLVSGIRSESKGSPHQASKAFDLRINGVSNETLVEVCKTLKDTGCGYYPNSSFVHVDVRAQGSGHVSWVDVSGPGEKPHYVKSWPLPSQEQTSEDSDLQESSAQEMPENLWPSNDDGELELSKDREMSVVVASTQGRSLPTYADDVRIVNASHSTHSQLK